MRPPLLYRSNQQLHEALQEDPEEREYKVAIEENLVVIAETKVKIEELLKKVSLLTTYTRRPTLRLLDPRR